MTPTSEARIIELLGTVIDELRRGNAPPAELLTQGEIAELLRVDERTVRTWVHEELVPAPITVGRVKRWRRAEFLAWLQARKS